MDKMTVDIICAALLAIVAALRKQYNRPDKTNVQIVIGESDTLTDTPFYKTGV